MWAEIEWKSNNTKPPISLQSVYMQYFSVSHRLLHEVLNTILLLQLWNTEKMYFWPDT